MNVQQQFKKFKHNRGENRINLTECPYYNKNYILDDSGLA